MVTDDVRAPTSQRVRYPTCGSATSWGANAHRPLCSLTGRLIDLGSRLDERDRIPSREDAAGDASADVR